MLRSLRLWVAILLVLAGGAQAYQWQSHQPSPRQDSVQAQSVVQADTISVAELPVEARETLRDIKRGGPYAFDRDGVVFGNFERILPKQSRGYYHEYTVKTPGVRSRGARRIISGGSGEYYYTSDHYQTFKRIRE